MHDVKGKPQNALKIFAIFIKGMKNDFTTRLMEQIRFGEGIDEDIHWVLTVPAIWNEKARQFMREAARQVILISQRNIINLALLQCIYFFKKDVSQSKFNLIKKYI